MGNPLYSQILPILPKSENTIPKSNILLSHLWAKKGITTNGKTKYKNLKKIVSTFIIAVV